MVGHTSRVFFIGAGGGLAMFYPAEHAEAKQFMRNVLRSPDDLIARCPGVLFIAL
jgi:fructoselysine-6-P-deglycase FrlB-like protein